MRVDPLYVPSLVNSLDTVSATEQTLSQELSSGSRVTSLSDDPGAAADNVVLTAQVAQNDTFTQTASTTEGRLQLSDSALGSVVSQLTAAISAATAANNSTLNSTNVIGYSNQLAGIRDEVLSLANTSYLGGFLFAGSQGSTTPFTLNNSGVPAVVVYNGDNNTTSIQTPTGQAIQLNLTGSQVFTTGVAGTDVFQTLNALVADFATGTPSATAVADTEALSTALNHVSDQRVILDGNITALQNAATYTQAESAGLLAEQTTLLQADFGKVTTQLSAAETQQTALYDVISTLEKGSLFDYIGH
ncbi:Flagellar hook-associated protein FlgL [Acidisarcina polymorpha]|uniref:Flagellar hook-associated protein FlgL n=1 Tax=Acidisarcina polymorpha TaxID=2211140 RepID=A0A2Z5FU91_9BACT|nr:flagellar hook-associated protein 3 [Acidisarcina polymorpha]AXC10413.1 Flagellar hook-associated protein FlgL [Acidisarcina polymorpha]